MFRAFEVVDAVISGAHGDVDVDKSGGKTDASEEFTLPACRGPCQTPSNQMPSSSLLLGSWSMKNLNARSKLTPPGTQLPVFAPPVVALLVEFDEAPPWLLEIVWLVVPGTEPDPLLSPVAALVILTARFGLALDRDWNRAPAFERVEALLVVETG